MKYTLTDSDVTITCSFAELVEMDSLGDAIYATPNQHGEAVEVYRARRPHFRYDFLLATVEDFCDAEGWSSLGWEDMPEEALQAAEQDEHTITAPRWPRGEEE